MPTCNTNKNILKYLKFPGIKKNTLGIRQKQRQLHKLHIRAKHTVDNTDWTNYKNNKATINKEISRNKTKYINDKLDNSSERWKIK